MSGIYKYYKYYKMQYILFIPNIHLSRIMILSDRKKKILDVLTTTTTGTNNNCNWILAKLI